MMQMLLLYIEGKKANLYLGWKYGMCEYLKNVVFVKNIEYVHS